MQKGILRITEELNEAKLKFKNKEISKNDFLIIIKEYVDLKNKSAKYHNFYGNKKEILNVEDEFKKLINDFS